MVDIQSKEVIDKISDELKVQPSMAIPRALGKDIQLVYGVNPPKEIKVRFASLSDGTSVTAFTAATGKRTFLVSASVTVSKDVVSPAIATQLNAFPVGRSSAVTMLMLRYEPLTVGSNLRARESWVGQGFEIEPGTIITLTNTSGTASIDASSIIYFYETNPQ